MSVAKAYLVALVLFTSLASHGVAADTNLLPQIVFHNLTNYCPRIDPDTIAGWKGYIAAEAQKGATNFDSLNTNLLTLFSSTNSTLAWLEWPSNHDLLTIAAAHIALEQYPPDGVKIDIKPIKLKDPGSNNWGQVLLWTGAKLQNPYIIDPTTKTLHSAGSKTSPYIEIGFNERYVMRSGDKFNDIIWAWSKRDETPADSKAHLVPFWNKVPDIAGSFGYVFNNNNSPTNFSASTIVGSSDIYADASVGIPLARYCSKDYSWKQQLTLEIDGGFVTDKEFNSIHPTIFVGGGYQAKLPNFIGSTNLPIYWFGRVGAARIDQPSISGTNVVFNSASGLSEPVFGHSIVASMGTSIMLPVTSAISLQAGGNVYFTSTASWNITLGATLDLSKLAKGLGVALGLSP